MKNASGNFPLIRAMLVLVLTPIAFLYLPALAAKLISM
jgi:hypothetical protein